MAAPTIDGIVDGHLTSGTSKTLAKTCSSDTTLLAVCILVDNNNAPTGVTYNGVAMTQRMAFTDTNNNMNMSWWTLQSPSVGSSYNVIASWSTSVNAHVAAISVIGAEFATSPVNAINFGDGIDIAITTTKANSLLLQGCQVWRSAGVDSPVVKYSETQLLNIPPASLFGGASAAFFCISDKAITSAGATNTGWTIGSSQTVASGIGVMSISPVPVSKTVTAKARVKQAGLTKTATSKARIRQLGFSRTVTAKATVKKLGVTRTITARGKIGTTRTKSMTAKANIVLPPRGYWKLRSKDNTYPAQMKDGRIKL